jgi:hypothetical protein
MKNKKLRVFKQDFLRLAESFENDIWFIHREHKSTLKMVHEKEDVINQIFSYFDLRK